jgi:UDP-N-acetylmuramoyl-tripeptide--D-alanyl-D-alanine ligase
VRVINYGFEPGADVTASDVEPLGGDGMRFRLHVGGENVEVRSPALGRHGVHNGLAGAAVGVAAGMDLGSIARGLARPYAAPHRSTLIDLGDRQVLDDSYNAAPDSMAAALDLLAALPAQRRIAVLGEMLELGAASTEAHRQVGRHAGRTADLLVAVGPTADDYAAGAIEAGMAQAAVRIAPDRDAAAGILLREGRPGDVILLKASRGAQLDLLLAPLQASAGLAGRTDDR